LVKTSIKVIIKNKVKELKRDKHFFLKQMAEDAIAKAREIAARLSGSLGNTIYYFLFN
jgi:hypothetical protein